MLVDWSGFMESVMDDEELARDVAEAYLDETPGLLKNLHVALRDRNAEVARRSAHTIKGSLRTLQATTAETALQVEQAAGEQRWEECELLTTQLETELTSVEQELRDRLAI